MKEDRRFYESKDNNSDYVNFEFTLIPYEEEFRQPPPFFPYPNTPFFPGNMLPPPPPNNPGGQNIPPSGPPNYIPSKNDKGVQTLYGSQNKKGEKDGFSPKAVSPGSISFCLYKFTYIWETNGRSYWCYLLNVDNRSVSGFRWLGRTWVYFGVDLRRIDSFVCYRSDYNDESSPLTRNSKEVEYESTKQEFSLSDIRDIYSKTLAYIDIPETKDDFLVETIGVVEGNSVHSKIPCKKTRVTSYRIVLEVSYPADFDEATKENINNIVDECSEAAIDILNSVRDKDKYLNPLEIFNSALKAIPSALKAFSSKFSVYINKLPGHSEIVKQITYTIRREKNSDRWRIL